MKTINEIVKSILRKRNPKPLAIVAVAKKKPTGVIMYGKRIPKPEAVRVLPKPKPKPVAVKYPNLKLMAISKDDEAMVDRLIKSDPLEALAVSNRLTAKVKVANSKIMAYNSLTQLQREREAAEIDLIKKAALSLTANLPSVSDAGLDVNWSSKVLISSISKIAFNSSLQDNVLWISNNLGDLSVKIGAQTIEVHTRKELLEAASKRLYNWSKMGKSLNNEKGEEPNVYDLIRGLGKSASLYKVRESKLKSSDWYLTLLVDRASNAPLQYTKESSSRNEVLEALALATAEEANKLGFYKDKSKAININCSDNRFGSSQLSDKVLLPFMESIIEKSSVAGKLQASNDAKNLLTGMKNLLPL